VDVPQYATKNIEDIQKDDTVIAFNPETRKVERRRVVEAYKRVTDHLRILTFAAADGTKQIQETTDEHPYWLPDRSEFIDAKDLKEGDRVTGPNGEIQTLLSSRYEPHPEGIPVFNLQVDGVHTYYVSSPGQGRLPVLVHNAACNVSDDTVVLYHGVGRRTPFQGNAFNIELSRQIRRGTQHLTPPDAGVFFTDDFRRAAQGYGHHGQVARSRVPREVAENLRQVDDPTEFHVNSQEILDQYFNPTLELLPTSEAFLRWTQGLF
jgi:hypothetical protein